ncbi:MAG: polysaccharide deacetylase family protein [Clostridia bacterium]|nr:polysaccharide deacetylase family protein [Clostridia bacterium]
MSYINHMVPKVKAKGKGRPWAFASECAGIKRLGLLFMLVCLLLPLVTVADGKEQLPQKVVYLTFDDGPKKTTPELLAILDELDVPATFFLLGYQARAFPEYTRMIYERGDTIACHTMDHSSGGIKDEPSQLQLVFRRFMKEMHDVLGDETFTTDLFRFPGGSTSYPFPTKKMVTDLGWSWFDWNAMTRDTYDDMNEKAVFASVRNTTKGRDVVILLAHDGKKNTRLALPDIVQYYRDGGYTFRRLSTSMEERRILARCPAHMRLPDLGPEGEQLLLESLEARGWSR